MTTDNRPPLGSAGRRDRRPPTIELSAGGGWRSAISWLQPDFPWQLLIAGGAGAALALLAVLIAGLWPGRDSGVSALEARLTRAEQQIAEFAGRPTPPAADPKSVDDLAGRLVRLETAVAAPRPPTTDPALVSRLATLEGDLKALSERIGMLTRRNEEFTVLAADARQRSEAAAAALAEATQRIAQLAPSSRGEIEMLMGRIAAIERAAGALESELRRRGGGETSDHSMRVAVIATVLRAAIERGDPFTSELAAAQALAANPTALAPLQAFAASGAPTAAVLARELLALAPSLLNEAATPARDAGFLERLQASAEKLVRVRPVDEAPGDDPAAVVARIEVRAAQADLAGALAELAKLPAPLRARAQGWIAKAQARNAAVEASQRFAADAVAVLGKPSP